MHQESLVTPERMDKLQELQQAVEELWLQNQDLQVVMKGQTLELDELSGALECRRN